MCGGGGEGGGWGYACGIVFLTLYDLGCLVLLSEEVTDGQVVRAGVSVT